MMLSVQNLTKEFPIRSGMFSKETSTVKAVSDISFHIQKGETLGLVGESGCGKTTLGRCILRLIEPSAGRILFNGQDLLKLSKAEMRRVRKDLQIIFQDPYSSLNPRMTVDEILREPLQIHQLGSDQKEKTKRILKLLDQCGLARESLSKYPREFSGGQRQRISIARALAVEPQLVICDEPVSALDVSIQAQIINLMQDLQKELGLAYLFIGHDLKVVEHLSSRVAVMYLGKIVELSSADDIYARPKHPYTQALLSSIPVADPHYKKQRTILKGELPSSLNPPSGCHFHPRCPIAQPRCQVEAPSLRELNVQTENLHPILSHVAACHFAQ